MDTSPGMSTTPGSIDIEATHNPFARGMITLEKGQECLDFFRIRMAPHFPFVMISESITMQGLVQDKPALCVAILAASCHDDRKLQRELGKLFNEIVVVRMIKGPFASLDMLQGLLIHLAWYVESLCLCSLLMSQGALSSEYDEVYTAFVTRGEYYLGYETR